MVIKICLCILKIRDQDRNEVVDFGLWDVVNLVLRNKVDNTLIHKAVKLRVISVGLCDALCFAFFNSLHI